MFNWISKLFGTGETKRVATYQSKQRNEAARVSIPVVTSKKCVCDGTPKGAAFMNRLKRRRAKNIMTMNQNRKLRGLFEYSL